MAFAGVRPQVLGNYHGTDGLRIHDLPEMEIDSKLGRVVFKMIPTRILIRDNLSKTGYNYEAFLCDEGCTILEKRLPDSLLEQIRHAYSRAAETMLQTTKPAGEDATMVRREFRAVALTSMGFSEEELKRFDKRFQAYVSKMLAEK